MIYPGLEPKIYIIKILEHFFSSQDVQVQTRDSSVDSYQYTVTFYPHYLHYYC